MATPEAILEAVLAEYVKRATALKERLVSAVQFGSTARGPLKRETDIDLLLIFETLPVGRMARTQIMEDLEKICLEELTKQLPKDYNICFSSKLKTVEESKHFSVLYLDMVDRSKILFDPQGWASSLLEKTKKWIQQSGAYRVEKGLKWYWVLGENITWDKESQIGWG